MVLSPSLFKKLWGVGRHLHVLLTQLALEHFANLTAGQKPNKSHIRHALGLTHSPVQPFA
jgi:hypothetical protein